MLDDASGRPPGPDPGTRGQGTWRDDSFAVVIGFPSDDGSNDDGDDWGLVNVGLDSNDDPHSTGDDSFSIDFGESLGDDDDGDLPDGNADEHELSFGASSAEYGALDVDLSPWAPLLGMLDSTEPEESPGDRPFSPDEAVEGAHALELRAESMLLYCERGAERTGELDRTEVGVSDDNRDVVAGRDQVEIDGMLDEHTGHGLVHVADEVEMNVGGPLRIHAHLEDNIIMGGVMRDEWSGGTFITAAMSDDMAAGLGIRCTAPLDLWVHGLMGIRGYDATRELRQPGFDAGDPQAQGAGSRRAGNRRIRLREDLRLAPRPAAILPRPCEMARQRRPDGVHRRNRREGADLFQGIGGSLDDFPLDPTSRTLAIRAELDNMALRAEATGDADRLARIRGAIDELDGFVHDTAVDIAVHAGEFPGEALGSQRMPIDADIDTDKLRSWFQEKLANAEARMAAAPAVPRSDEEMLAQMLMGDEAPYYRQMIKSLDKGVNPLTESREMIAFHRLEVEDYYHSIAEPAAASGSSAPGSAPSRPLTAHKLDLYRELQSLLVTTLSDPQFKLSPAVTDVDLFAPHARIPLEAGLDLLEPDSLRLSADHEVLPPLPAPSASGRASGLEDARNASFTRSALEASEETLVRRVLDFGGLDVPGPSRQTSSGADSGFGGTPATSPGFRRTPPDNALPPVVEEQSGRWIVEPTAELDASPATSDGLSPPAQRGTSSQSSAVSWDSGLREAGDSERSSAR